MVDDSKKKEKLKEITSNYKKFQQHPSKKKMESGIMLGLILFAVGCVVVFFIPFPFGYLGAYITWGLSFINIQTGFSLFMFRMEIDQYFQGEAKKILDDLGIEVEK